jgi:hypothetical protein
VNFQAGAQAQDNQRGEDQGQLGTSGDCSADGADPDAARHHQADFSRRAQRPQPKRTDGVIDFIDHLQHPFHSVSLGERPRLRRAWDHTLAMVTAAA